jgi:hypothetical protein
MTARGTLTVGERRTPGFTSENDTITIVFWFPVSVD